MSTPVPLAALALAALASLGCADGGGDAVADALPEWALHEELRIGSVDDPDQALTSIGQVMVGPDGRVYVSQPQDAMVRVFDRTGAAAGVIGTRGQGPGEFRSMAAMGFLGDTLWVSDRGARRVSRFAADGTFLTSATWLTPSWQADGTMFMASPPQVILPDGSALAVPGRMVTVGSTSGGMQAVEPALVRSAPVVRMDTTGQITDTVLWQRRRAGSTIFTFQGQQLAFQLPLNDAPLVAVAPDGTGAVEVERELPPDPDGPVFTTRRITPDGDTAFARAYPYTPVPMRDEHVRRLAEDLSERYNRAGPGPSAAQIEGAWRSAGFVPESLPPVTEMAVAQDGTIWLRREEPPPGEPAVWEILDGTGAPIGTVRLPAGQRVATAADGILVVTERDELDVPYVVLYRTERAGG
jgi:hypothetical protein